MVNQTSSNATITFPATVKGAFWQSFTATQSSKLKKIAFSFGYNSLLDVTVIIREGEGIDNTINTIIYRGTWKTTTEDQNWTEYILDTAFNVPKLKKNQKYTIQFTELVNPQTQINANQGSIYDGGKFSSANFKDFGDLMFKVWVEPEPDV